MYIYIYIYIYIIYIYIYIYVVGTFGVYFARAQVAGLSSCVLVCCCPGARSGSGSFQKVGLQCPPLPSLLSLLLLGICLSMCGWDGSACS